MTDPYYLALRDVAALGKALLAAESEELLVADLGLLGSALARPHQSVFGEDAYPDLVTKAAVLMESLARNHTLVDGNKRLAWSCAKLFLRFNGLALRAPSVDEGETFVLAVSQGMLSTLQIAELIGQWASTTSIAGGAARRLAASGGTMPDLAAPDDRHN